MITSMVDIKNDTGHWSDEDWRAELGSWDNNKLLEAWQSTMRAGSFHKWSEHQDTFYHAEHCMYGEILERMGGRHGLRSDS